MSCTAIIMRKAQSSNSTSTSFSDVEASTTAPSGTGVIDLLDRDLGWSVGDKVPSYIDHLFFGEGSDTQTFDCRIYGIQKTNDSTPVYLAKLLVDVTIALGPTTGCDGAAIAASNLVADTITQNEGPAAPWVDIISTADDTPASMLLHTRCCRWLKYTFDMTGATSGNVYIAPAD
jgi:hypothetical protein